MRFTYPPPLKQKIIASCSYFVQKCDTVIDFETPFRRVAKRQKVAKLSPDGRWTLEDFAKVPIGARLPVLAMFPQPSHGATLRHI